MSSCKKGCNTVPDKPHSKNGGIKAVVADDNNRPILIESGEVVINKEAALRFHKELSAINESTGGVPIKKPVVKSKFKSGGGISKHTVVGFEIQTILFDKDKFTLTQAKKWLKENNFKSSVDEGVTVLRFRQREPGDFNKGSFKTKKISQGVSVVLGKLIKFESGGNIDTEKEIEFRKQGFKKNTVSFEDFHLGTFANFIKIKQKDAPVKPADYISKSGSKYWYENNTVIRASDHWGRTIATCNWLLNSSAHKGFSFGACELQNFKRQRDDLLRSKDSVGKKFKIGKTVLIRNGAGRVDIEELNGTFKKLTSSFYVFDNFKVANQTLAYVQEIK